jgi:hypothetical protein
LNCLGVLHYCILYIPLLDTRPFPFYKFILNIMIILIHFFP